MLRRVEDFRSDCQGLGSLVGDLRGLFVEADPHEQAIRDQFEQYWSPIDGQYELRTEAWAPPGATPDEDLDRALDSFERWVGDILASDISESHC
jgi:hypothetical protein